MTTKNMEAQIVECDMCGLRLRNSLSPCLNLPFKVITINGYDYDFCLTHYKQIMPSLEFLTTVAGVDIAFVVKGQEG